MQSDIISDITIMVSGDYGNWYIGITAEPEQRKIDHGYPPGWRSWDTGFEQTARYIEKFFLARGMRGGTGGGHNPTHVYIFKH